MKRLSRFFAGCAAVALCCATALAETPQPAPQFTSSQPSTFGSSIRLISSVVRRDPHALALAALDLANAQTTKALTPRLAKRMDAALPPSIPAELRDQYMEKPDLLSVNPGHYEGESIYFINGVATSKTNAQKQAEGLADQLKRPVILLYNPTAIAGEDELSRNLGLTCDLATAVYERTWPLRTGDEKSPLSQQNAATRQLTWLLVNTKGNITIVSHSQGCLIMRNALLTASHLTDDPINARVSWIATGAPLRDEEIFPRPAKVRVIANPADPIAQSLGLRLDPEMFSEQNLQAHSFLKEYLPQIKPGDI